MIIPLQTEKSLVYEKRKSRKNHLDCRLDTICHPRIAPYINLRMAGKGIGPMEYWMINAAEFPYNPFTQVSNFYTLMVSCRPPF